MTDRQLRDEVITFFAAGHETTALALTWTLYLLSRHPGIERALHDEVDRALGEGETTFADVEALPYTRMVIQEAMRLFPPGHSFSRVAVADDEVGGHAVRAGSVVTISPYLTHRNPRLWEDPMRRAGLPPGRDALRSGAVHTRSGQGASSFRVLALWRRSAHLYRQGLCHDGGVRGARHHRPRLSPAYGARTPGRTRTAGLPFARATVCAWRRSSRAEQASWKDDFADDDHEQDRQRNRHDVQHDVLEGMPLPTLRWRRPCSVPSPKTVTEVFEPDLACCACRICFTTSVTNHGDGTVVEGEDSAHICRQRDDPCPPRPAPPAKEPRHEVER